MQKVFTNHDVVKEFFKQSIPKGRNSKSSILFDRNVLYSYGTHFILAIIQDNGFVIVNGDSYSPTTSQHQSLVRNRLTQLGMDNFIVPFSALRAANIDPHKVQSIERGEARYVTKTRKNPKTGVREDYDVHLMGSTVFEYQDRCFLSGLDETATNPWKSHFLAELVRPCVNVADAYGSMKPLSVLQAIIEGREVQRQGEFFFVPASHMKTILEATKTQRITTISKDFYLTHPVLNPERSQRHHVAHEGFYFSGDQYVRGYITHTLKKHKRLHFKDWHLVCPNLVKNSWSASGLID